ncbi:MAG: AI-2E family transporter [Bryobacteraceae bacterium]
MIRAERILFLGFATALLLFVAYLARQALLLIYISAVFAVVLSPAVDRVHRLSIWRWRPSRGAAILLFCIAIALLVALLCVFALPPVISEMQDLVVQLPDLLNTLRTRFRSTPLLRTFDTATVTSYVGSHVGKIASLFAGFAGTIVSAATASILTAYLILDGNRVLRWLMSLFPVESRNRLETALRHAGERMRKWLWGQAILMLILGSASAITFGSMGLRFFYLLALFAGLANIIPLLGPIATVIVAALIAAIDSPWRVLGVLIFYLVYQQVENAFLTPRIMQSQVQLPPSAVVVALLIGGELAGAMGALVAVPTAVLCSVLIDEYLVHHTKS